MAYEAAKDSGVRSEVLDLFQKSCISTDLSWYVERGLVTRASFLDSIAEAYDRAFPILLNTLQDSKEADDYITAPIMSGKAWDNFVKMLPAFDYRSNRLGGYQSKI